MYRIAVVVLLLGSLFSAVAQSVTTFTVYRDDTEIIIANHALSADGARSIGNNQNCEEGIRMTIVYGPAPGMVIATIEETTITSTLALTRTVVGEDDKNEESLEMLPAEVSFKVPGCIDEQTAIEGSFVTVEQGRTTVLGTHFELPAGAEEGTLHGPIDLTRQAEDGSEQLTATANELTVVIDSQETTLFGEVSVRSKERTTTADTLVLDEEAGTATLTGSPARSVKGTDVVEGAVLLYYLDTDDIVVVGGVQAEFEID